MSPTRRDILAAIAVAPLAAMLPANTGVASAIPAVAESVDVTSHIGGCIVFREKATKTLVAGDVEIYFDQEKAIVWLGGAEDSTDPLEMVFRHPVAVGAIQVIVSAMGAQFGGETDTERVRNDYVICGDCRGIGWFKRTDGSERDCPSCCGKGYGGIPAVLREKRHREMLERRQ